MGWTTGQRRRHDPIEYLHYMIHGTEAEHKKIKTNQDGHGVVLIDVVG